MNFIGKDYFLLLSLDMFKVEYDDGEYHFDELVEESGDSVVLIFVFKPESKVSVIIALSEFACSVNTHYSRRLPDH